MAREMGMTLLHAHSFELACQLILDVILDNTVAQNCSIMLLDQEKDQLFLVCANDPVKNNYIIEPRRVFSKEGARYSFKLGEGAAGQALEKKELVLINDVKNSAHFASEYKTQVQIGSLLCIPLMVENRPFGVLNLSHSDGNIFEKNDIYLFNIIANFVAVAINSTLMYEKLQHSEAEYRALSENSNDGIAIIQDDLHIYTNPKYQVITGYSAEDLERLPFETLLDTSNNRNDVHRVKTFLKYGSGCTQYEVRLCGQDGKKIDVEINFSSTVHNGKRGVILSARDLTDRKELEKRLIRAQKMEAIGILAGGVAHDLNNILSGIVSYPDLLLMQVPEESPLRKPLLTMQESGKKATDIVQDLLTLARRGVATNDVVNLNDIVSQYLKSPEYENLKTSHPEVEVKTRCAKDLLSLLGSPVHLSKTIMNLISNATEAMPGGGKVVVSTENLYVDGPLRGFDDVEEGDYVTLTISDSGVGIPPEDIERIFEPFYTKKKMGISGTGLGMAVVWGAIKDHHGFIDVQSTEGKGTTFTLYFPATRELKVKAQPPLAAENYVGKGESILVVDDVKEQREIAFTILNQLGYSVTTAASGEEAIEIMKKNSVDLLILDMIMEPGMDGLDAYKQILQLHPGQKAIVASGFSETERVKEAKKLGAGQYIKKPYTVEKIGVAVKIELGPT